MSTRNLIFVLLLVLLLGVFLGVLLTEFRIIKLFPVKQTSQQIQSSAETSSNPLPIPADMPGVERIMISYALSGKVKNITSATLSFQEQTLPSLSLTKDTQIFKIGKDNTQETASFSDIKENDSVVVSAGFDLSTKTWTVFRINLISPATAPSK